MTTGATGQLGLALPVQGELSGTWGDTVNNGITQYTNIAIAATLTLTNDGAVTLANTTGDASASNITSTLTGAGTVTAQFAIVRVTGTLTTAKVVTAPSYSKTYTVVNAATGGIVTFKAAGQTGVSIAVGESAFVYFNGTDYVKVSSTVDTGVTSFTAGTTGFTPSTATTGAVTLAGTLATTNGGTGLTSFTSGGVVYASSTSALATGSALTFDGSVFGLSVATGIIRATSTTGTNAAYLYATNTGGDFYFGRDNSTGGTFSSGSAYSAVLYSAGAYPMVFFTNGAEKMRLTSAGEVGIGTTAPSAKLTVISTYVSDTTVQTRFSDNTGGRLEFGGNASAGKWINANDSGTATAVPLIFQNGSNVERMRLDTAGNVGIGTSSPAAILHTSISGSGEVGRFATTTDNTPFISIYSNGSIRTKLRGSSAETALLTQGSTPLLLGTNDTERARILSTGAVTIGDTSSYARFAVRGFTGTSGSYNLVAHFGDGVSGNSGYIVQGGSGSNTVGLLADSGSLILGSGLAEKARISNAGGFSVGTTSDPGAGAIYATGNITAFFSDKRLKTVSGKIENALDKVAQLSGVYYTFNDTAKSFGYDSDEEHVGVLAQDVEAVLPQIVKAAPFDLDENNNSKSGENYKTVQYDKLVPLLIEAINELQAKVKALEAK